MRTRRQLQQPSMAVEARARTHCGAREGMPALLLELVGHLSAPKVGGVSPAPQSNQRCAPGTRRAKPQTCCRYWR
eukprot:6144741-Pyramimonas_sp.AAC.1